MDSASATSADLLKLSKVLPLLGSPIAGERDAAAIQADRIVRTKLGGWDTVGRMLVSPPATASLRRDVMPDRAKLLRPHQRRAKILLAGAPSLSEWEVRFLNSISVSLRLSVAQEEKLGAIERASRARSAADV